MNKYSHQQDSAIMSKNLILFVLSRVHNGVEKSQLNIVTSSNVKSTRELLQIAGSDYIDVEYFNHNKKYYYPFCELTPLSGEKYFLKGNIMYSDSSLAVLIHVTSLGEDAEELISGIDNKGQTIFTVEESHFPNIKEMRENNYSPRNYADCKCFRHKDQIIFMFAKYGALSIDLTTGTELWKYEP
jgi:hypothetical protein